MTAFVICVGSSLLSKTEDVTVDLKVQAALNPNENCTPVPNNGCPLHKLRFKLDSGVHGNLMPISMCK